LYRNPPQCQPQAYQARTPASADRHSWRADGLKDYDTGYHDYGQFLTDCTVFGQCNDIHNYHSPSSGSKTYVEQGNHCLSQAVATPGDCYSPSKGPIATGVLASATPGLPQLGVDYEDSFAAKFFMNPFGVSFPGDIPYDGGLGMSFDHIPEDEGLTLDGPWPVHDPAHTADSSQVMDNHLADTGFSLATAHHPQVPRTAETQGLSSGSKQSSPLVNVINASPSTASEDMDSANFWSTPPEIGKDPAAKAPSKYSTPDDTTTTASKSKPSGGFQFVDASDRRTIVRLRNTMVSRKHRDNKVQRIKELEKLLEERDRELEELRRKVAEK
jgi:hypothetical protein